MGPRIPSSVPSLHHYFVVGPGFHPITYKVTSSVIAGQFVHLASLLAQPNEDTHSPTVSIDGHIILSQFHRPKRRISSILEWVQAFSIFTTIISFLFSSKSPRHAGLPIVHALHLHSIRGERVT